MRAWINKRASWLKIVLGVSVLLRLFAAFYLGGEVTSQPGIADQVSYHNLAVRLLNGHGFTFDRLWWPLTQAGEPTAHWSYLYTLFLWVIYWFIGVAPFAARLIQAVITGILHPLLVYRITRRVFGFGPALMAAAGTAVYIYFIYYAAALMTEAFYITLILAVIELSLMLVGGRSSRDPDPGSALPRTHVAVLLGIALGGTLLLRQVFLLFVPFLFMWVWAVGKKAVFWRLVLAGGIMLALVLPVTFFNWRQFDRFVLLNTNAGFAFFWGNHPVYGSRFVPILEGQGAYQNLIPEELRGLDEAALDQALLGRGLQFVFDDPLRYIELSISRIPSYFQFWPSPQSSLISNISRVASFGLFLPFILWGLVRGLPAGWRDPRLLLIVFALVYTGVHLLTWTLIRYRLPVDAVLLVFSGPVFWGLARKPLLKKWLGSLARQLGSKAR